MEPENDGFQKESPFPGTSFWGSMLNFWGVQTFSEQLHWVWRIATKQSSSSSRGPPCSIGGTCREIGHLPVYHSFPPKNSWYEPWNPDILKGTINWVVFQCFSSPYLNEITSSWSLVSWYFNKIILQGWSYNHWAMGHVFVDILKHSMRNPQFYGHLGCYKKHINRLRVSTAVSIIFFWWAPPTYNHLGNFPHVMFGSTKNLVNWQAKLKEHVSESAELHNLLWNYKVRWAQKPIRRGVITGYNPSFMHFNKAIYPGYHPIHNW